MNYKTGLEDFIGKESLSKTLRNALIPTESTKIHMEEMGVIRDDELRAEKQQELKEIMDDYYKYLLRKTWSNSRNTMEFLIPNGRNDGGHISTKKILIKYKTKKERKSVAILPVR